MSFLKDKGGSKETQTINPAVMGMLQENYGRAKGVADAPYTRFSGDRVAGFTPTQDMGRAMMLRAVGAPVSSYRQPGGVGNRGATAAPMSMSADQYLQQNGDVAAAWDAMSPDAKTGMGWNSPQDFATWHMQNQAAQENRKGFATLDEQPAGGGYSGGGGGGGGGDWQFGPGVGDVEMDDAVGLTRAAGGFREQMVGGTGYDAQQADVRGYGVRSAGMREGQSFDAGVRGYDPAQMRAARASASVSGSQGYDARQGAAAQTDRGAIRDVRAREMSGTDLSAYTNPWDNEVVANTLKDLERQRAVAINEGKTDVGGSWGGSRHGVMEAETNRAALDAAARASAELRSAGFRRAQDLAVGDIDRDYAGQVQNQGVDRDTAFGNTGFRQAMGLANVDADNSSRAFTADAFNRNSIASADRETGVSTENARLETDASGRNMDAVNTERRSFADSFNRAEMDNAGRRTAMSRANADAFNQNEEFNAGQDNAERASYADSFNRAQQFNASQVNGARQFGADTSFRASLANQDAGLEGNRQRLSAAGQLSSLGQMRRGFALDNADRVAGLGSQEQAALQRFLDGQYGDYVEERDWGMRGQGIRNSALGMFGTPTNTNIQNRGGYMDYAQMGANAFAAMAMSDRRLKTDIELIGSDVAGVPWYFFRYDWDHPTRPLRLGVMAQDLISLGRVDAVREQTEGAHAGFYAVDYGTLGGFSPTFADPTLQALVEE